MAALLVLAGCDRPAQAPPAMREAAQPEPVATRQRTERRLDDLISSGLGIEGLRGSAPELQHPEQPDAAELRRLALYTNHRALQHVGGSGFGTEHGPLRPVAGVEILAWRLLPGMRHPHAVALQLPDSFRPEEPCLLVGAASGSRGVYGAAAVTGDWALLRGCAAVYTDKGAGTGFYDLDSGAGVAITGELVKDAPGFTPDLTGQPRAVHRVAVKHAHSGDNPEAHWGEFVIDAARFALGELSSRYPGMPAPVTIAAGISNGGSAVLRAAERDSGELFDAVVAAEPNIYPPAVAAKVSAGGAVLDVREAMPLYQYALLLGLYQPCAVLHDVGEGDPFAAVRGLQQALLQRHCRALADAGLLAGADLPPAAGRKLDELRLTGAARRLGMVNISLNLWPALAAAYGQAYSRKPVAEPVCGIGYAAVDGQGRVRPVTRLERARWFGESSGIPPTAGIVPVTVGDEMLAAPEQIVVKTRCWQKLWQDPQSVLRRSIEATRATGKFRGLPAVIVHGRADSLVAVNHASRPYAAAALQQGSELYYYEIEHAQHFDALLGLPGMDRHIIAMHPYFLAALDNVRAYLQAGRALPPSQVIRARPADGYRAPRLPRDPGANTITFRDGVLRIPE